MKKLWMKSILAAAFATVVSMAQAQSPSTVLVVANQNNANSMALANYYMQKRGIPASNELLLNWTADDNADKCSLAQYNSLIATPIYAKIKTLAQIDYIVLCRNLPVKINDTTGSVDSALAAKTTARTQNTYMGRGTAFSSKTYNMYLVTRLDGWSWADAFALVDHSLAAKRGGTFYYDSDPTKDSISGYSWFNTEMKQGVSYITTAKLPIVIENTTAFLAPTYPLAGYVSWGSNDAHFSAAAFNALQFLPGAIAETAVSTSASNLRYPGGGQSQIATLIHEGVTGVKGYVTEPFLNATARPDGLFYWYTVGQRNLAETFYASSAFIGWKDVVVGDPLCAPYR